MNYLDLPKELKKVVQSETKDFIVQNKSLDRKAGISTLIFGVFWLGFTLFFFIGFFGEVLRGGIAHFSINGKPATADLEHLGALLIPAIILFVFSIVGIGMIYAGIRKFRSKGSVFVATPSLLAFQHNKEISLLSWDDFSDEIDLKKNALLLNFNKKRVINLYNHKEIINPKKLIINGLENPEKIMRICQKRIKQNQ